jgi:hypothetical protein
MAVRHSTVVHIDTSPEGMLKAYENLLYGHTGLGFLAANSELIQQIDEALGDRYEADKKRFFDQISPGGEIKPLGLAANRMYSYVRTLRNLAEERGDVHAAQSIKVAITKHLEKTHELLMI